MKYARPHTHNGVTREAGASYDGDVHTARFLYQRGVLEADGGPDDGIITRSPGPRAAQRWDITETDPTILKTEE